MIFHFCASIASGEVGERFSLEMLLSVERLLAFFLKRCDASMREGPKSNQSKA